MSAPLPEALEMETKDEKTASGDEQRAAESDESASPESPDPNGDSLSEFEQPLWSIVTFQDVAVRGLNYDEALKWLEKLDEQNISGLCIVTDEAAARISEK